MTEKATMYAVSLAVTAVMLGIVVKTLLAAEAAVAAALSLLR